MKLHNCYTLRTKSKTVTAYNSLVGNFWSKVLATPHWANVFVLTDSDGERKTVDAQCTYLNCDPQRGGVLQAVYGATTDGTPNKRYTRIALASSQSEGDEMSVASVEYTSDGETLEISAAIYLQVDEGDGNVLFCGGDNSLIKMLLGCGGAYAFTVAGGTCGYPSRVCARSADLVGTQYPVTPAPTQSGIEFSAVTPSDGKEILLLDHGVPVLRAVRDTDYTLLTGAGVVGSESALLLARDYPETVSTLRLDGASLLRYDTCRVCDSIVSVRTGDVTDLGVEGEVISDPSETYIALITANYVEVYEVSSLDLKRVLRVQKTDEWVEICRGGTLILWGSGALTVYERNSDGEYESYSKPLARGTSRAIVRDGNQYHGIYRIGALTYRFFVRKDSYGLLEEIPANAQLCVLGHCGDALYLAHTELKVKTVTSDISGDYRCDAVKESDAARTILGVGDCFFIATQDGVTRLHDLIHNRATVVRDTLRVNGRLIYDQGGVYIYDYYHGMRAVSGNFAMQGVTSACLAGDGLFAVRNNKLYTYYRNGNAMAVRLPVGAQGKTALYNVRASLPVGLGKAAKFQI